jgi:hypothetical protein
MYHMSSSGMKRGAVVLVLFLLIITLANMVNAFGVSTPYLENNTLKVLPGQNYTYTITLQNGDEQGYYVDIIYSSTDNIANLVTGEYYTPAKTYNNTFEFNILIPSSAKSGDRYVLEYSAKPRVDNNGTVPLGIEIKRSIDILVTDDKNTNIQPIISPKGTLRHVDYGNIFQSAWKYLVFAVVLILAIFISLRLWKLSKGLSLRLNNKHKSNYTISQAISLAEIRTLLQKISDEEYELPEIRKIFKNKLSELTNNEIVEEISRINRREAIIALDHILK